MQSRLRILGHPVHPMVVDLPIVVFPLLVGLDLLWGLTHNAAAWEIGGWLGMAGVCGGILAILTGTIDLAAIPHEGRVYRVAAWHFTGGLTVHTLYICTVWARWPIGSGPAHAPIAIAFDVAGLVGVFVQGYLGSELRTRHHIGVPTVAEGAEPTMLKS
ncbi:MAG: DUF2231 domain-containing protein [Thermoplasmatota archaeon]